MGESKKNSIKKRKEKFLNLFGLYLSGFRADHFILDNILGGSLEVISSPLSNHQLPVVPCPGCDPVIFFLFCIHIFISPVVSVPWMTQFLESSATSGC